MTAVGHQSRERAGTHGRRVALGVAALLCIAPAPAAAFGSYGSDLETGSAIGLLVFGGVVFVPAAIALMDPPLTAQRIVGRSLVIAGGLTAIAFGVYYFAADDPLWIPHALGWGIGGGLAATGFIVWFADDEGEPAAPADGPAPGGPEPAAGTTGAPDGAIAPPAAAGRAGFGLAPLVVPGGLGMLVAGRW